MSKIKKNYTNRHVVSSFSGIKPILDSNKHLSAADVNKELQKIPTWNLFKPVRSKYATRKYRVFLPNYLMSLDLADFGNMSSQNKGYR